MDAKTPREHPEAPASSFINRNYGARSSTQPTTKRLVDAGGADFYPTPAWATQALLNYEQFKGEIWECACGDGAMSEVLNEINNKIYSSDLIDRGYGETDIDFLTATKTTDNIITNPPYNLAGDFVLQAQKLCRKKTALLLRLAFLEGAERCRKIFEHTPPSRIWVFSERITFYPKNAERKGSGTTAYAWLVWDKESRDKGKLGWIAPGHKPNSRSARPSM
ncbi:MAG: hypothetical protein ACTSV1_06395 [Alphaproteobacteria bacterium]